MSRSYAVKAALVGAFTFGALAAAPTSAEAQGSRLNFEGAANLIDPAGGGSPLLFIDFLTDGAISGPPTGTVVATETISGEFSAIEAGDEGVITDLTVSSEGVVGTPINPFLVMGPFTFTLENAPMAEPGPFNFGPLTLIGTPTGTVGFFGVNGTVMGGDFGTGRSFSGLFTAQFAGRTPAQVFGAVNSGGTLPVSFSAEFIAGDATVIPEPSTYLLVATGMAAIGFIGRRRRQTQA